MIYLALPVGTTHGWGVCGRYITRELAGLAGVQLITNGLSPDAVGDELEYAALRQLLLPQQEKLSSPLDGPLLQGIPGGNFLPMFKGLRGRRTVGYTFFEDNLIPPAYLDNIRANYDHLVCGSSWCTQVLRERGITNTSTILQGVDGLIFHPAGGRGSRRAGEGEAPAEPRRREGEAPAEPPAREFFADRFIVFSGGKFELRKGQDIVIAAWKVFQQRHKDVLLINSWFNHWSSSMLTMKASRHIRFDPPAGEMEYHKFMTGVLAEAGIDVSRVIIMAPRNNALMARIYRNSDVGLFPNRCEGGTNLVLMEFMACGRPAIVSDSTGHKDIITAENSLPIRKMARITVQRGATPTAEWDDPDLEETIEHLEWAYQHRDRLAALGARAAEDMAKLTWRKTAQEFLGVLG